MYRLSARLTHALALLIAGCPSLAIASGYPLPSHPSELRDSEYSVSFTFKEHGRPSERFRERVRCTYDGIDQKTGAHNWRGDKHQDFERIIAFGLVVSYDITNLCATRETNYIFQFSVKHNGERTYVYPQNLEAYGVTVTSFAVASVENAL